MTLPTPAGSTATSLPTPGAVSLPGAGPAASTGSTAGGAAPADGNPAAAFAQNAGSVASLGASAGAAAHEVASSTTGRSVSATISGPAGGRGTRRSWARVDLEDAPGLADSPSVAAERPASPEIAPAELLPGDLEGLERALGQLMRRFDEMGEDLAGWLTQFSTLEMLAAAGMVVLACEVIRRWERRRQLAIPRVQVGPSGRPGPFYRPRGYPFGAAPARRARRAGDRLDTRAGLLRRTVTCSDRDGSTPDRLRVSAP